MRTKLPAPYGVPSALWAAARDAPLLSEQEEREAFERGDTELLFRSHLRIVIKLARQFQNYKTPSGSIEDLIGVGSTGLMQAIARFDPAKGARLVTPSIYWIKAAITELILRDASQVKLGTTAAGKKLFFNRRHLDSDTVENVAKRFGVTEKDVQEAKDRQGRDYSLNAPFIESDNGDTLEFIDTLASAEPSPEEILLEKDDAAHNAALLRKALGTLTEREREIVLARQEGKTLDALSVVYGVTRERCRQIEQRGIEKMKVVLRKLPPPPGIWWETRPKPPKPPQPKRCRGCDTLKARTEYITNSQYCHGCRAAAKERYRNRKCLPTMRRCRQCGEHAEHAKRGRLCVSCSPTTARLQLAA